MGYFDMLFGYEWELTKSPAGAWQWTPKDIGREDMVPDAHDPSRSTPMMTTADMAMRMDPAYEKISQALPREPGRVRDAFARAWFKLTHRDMGPRRATSARRCRRKLIWQDPVPAVDHELIDEGRHRRAQGQDPRLRPVDLRTGLDGLGVGLDLPRLDKRGGANGARIRLAPQKDWAVNEPRSWQRCSQAPSRRSRGVQQGAVRRQEGLAGRPDRAGRLRGVEQAAKEAGTTSRCPSRRAAPMRRRSMTDVESFAVLEPQADGFRNYQKPKSTRSRPKSCWSTGRTC
jgi:catalase-peroxidase